MATEIDSDLFEWSYEGGVALRYRPYTLRRAVLLRFFFSYVHLGDRCHSIPLHQTTIPPNCSWLACWHDEWRPSLPR